MSEPSWKQAERRMASLFGTRRRPLSGGNQGGGRDDSMHPVLFIEHKQMARSSLHTLYNATAVLAKAEDRVPIIGISQKRSPGILVVVKSTDLEILCQEWVKANGPLS